MRVHCAKVALGPGTGEALKVCGTVFRSRGRTGSVVPQKHGHVGEGRRGNEIAGHAMREGSSRTAFGEIVVVGGDGDSENRALTTADVDGIEGIFLSKASGLY